MYNPQNGTFSPQGNSAQIQGNSTTLQAGKANPQLTVAPARGQSLGGGGGGGAKVAPTGVARQSAVGGSGVDPAAAARAAQVAELRGQVTNIVNGIKDIFNARYGQVDQSAAEQAGKLNDRFGNESQDVTTQVEGENNKLGAAYAGRGAFDSSYRGNDVDTVTHAGEGQIRDLGTELHDNLSKIAAWVTQQKSSFDAQKGGLDTVLSHLNESTDPGELTSLRNSLDARIADLRASSADNNTQAQNMSALSSIAPSNARAIQLKTTLSQIVAGNADSGQKSAIGSKLISSAGLSSDEQKQLQSAFQADLSAGDKTKTQPTA